MRVVNPIELTYTVDRRMALRGYRVCHRSFYAALATSLVLALVVLAISGDVFLLILVVAMLIAHELSGRRRLRHHKGSRQMHVEITSDDVRIEDEESSGTCAWTLFKRVSFSGGFWLLRAHSGGSLVLPAAAFNPQETEAFVSLMRRRGLMPQADEITSGSEAHPW